LAFTRLRMGDLAERRNPAEAEAHFDISQRLYRSRGDTWGAARALVGLGFGEAMGNQLVAAADHYRQAMAMLGMSGAPWVRVRALSRLAMALAGAGHTGEPERYASGGVRLARTLNDRGLLAQALEEQGGVAHYQGRFEDAQHWVEEALALLQELGERYQRTNTHLTLANILLHRGDWEGCRVHTEQSLALVPANQHHGYVMWAQYLLSAVALANHVYDLSLRYGLEAIRMAHRIDLMFLRASTYSAIGMAALLNGDQVQARRHLSESLLYVEGGTSHREALPALLFAAFFLALKGDVIAASRAYVELRHQRYIIDSVFCQQIAGRHLEALLDRLAPEQLAAVHAAPAPSDLRALAAEMHARLEAMG
jgi:tetratricopeptide (TPR) repeat protein